MEGVAGKVISPNWSMLLRRFRLLFRWPTLPGKFKLILFKPIIVVYLSGHRSRPVLFSLFYPSCFRINNAPDFLVIFSFFSVRILLFFPWLFFGSDGSLCGSDFKALKEKIGMILAEAW